MKRLLLIALLFTLIPVTVNAQDSDNTDCEPEALGEWMIERQIGLNRADEMIGQETIVYLDALLLLTEVRIDLETLPRPACADELYSLTRDLYINRSDTLVYYFAGIDQSGPEWELLWQRDTYYNDNAPELFSSLRQIAGVDVRFEAVTRAAEREAELESALNIEGDADMVTDPIEIPAGVYRVTATTTGDFRMESIEITGSCDNGLIISEYSSDGSEYDLTAVFESQGCTAVFDITYIEAPYTITWEKLD